MKDRIDARRCRVPLRKRWRDLVETRARPVVFWIVGQVSFLLIPAAWAVFCCPRLETIAPGQ